LFSDLDESVNSRVDPPTTWIKIIKFVLLSFATFYSVKENEFYPLFSQKWMKVGVFFNAANSNVKNH